MSFDTPGAVQEGIVWLYATLFAAGHVLLVLVTFRVAGLRVRVWPMLALSLAVGGVAMSLQWTFKQQDRYFSQQERVLEEARREATSRVQAICEQAAQQIVQLEKTGHRRDIVAKNRIQAALRRYFRQEQSALLAWAPKAFLSVPVPADDQRYGDFVVALLVPGSQAIDKMVGCLNQYEHWDDSADAMTLPYWRYADKPIPERDIVFFLRESTADQVSLSFPDGASGAD